MLKKSLLLALTAFIGLSLAAGCSKAPSEALDTAKAAIEKAKSEEADRYLPDEFKTVSDSFNAAVEEIEKQNSKSFLTRNYNHAAELLNSVTANINTLSEKVSTRKAEVKTEVSQKVIDVNAVLAESKELLAKAPKSKEATEALKPLISEVSTAENSVPNITALVDKGDYLSALDRATAIYNKVTSVNQELRDAIAKVSSK